MGLRTAVPEPDKRRCVLVFVKAPETGQVKTRLAQKMEPQLVAALYRYFVEDILSTLAGCDEPIRIFFHPPEAGKSIGDWLGRFGACRAQAPGDLGIKMGRAFTDAFQEGYERVLLIGTDFPDLPPDIIREGFAMLAELDAVIGPTFDGGYYLIGLKPDTYTEELFADIAWSTRSVLAETMLRFREKGLSVHHLPPWRDIDTYEDLLHFVAAMEKGGGRAAKTVRFLRRIGF